MFCHAPVDVCHAPVDNPCGKRACAFVPRPSGPHNRAPLAAKRQGTRVSVTGHGQFFRDFSLSVKIHSGIEPDPFLQPQG